MNTAIYEPEDLVYTYQEFAWETPDYKAGVRGFLRPKRAGFIY